MSVYCKIMSDGNSEEKSLILIFSAMGIPPGRFELYKTFADYPGVKVFINDEDNKWYQNGIVGVAENIEQSVNFLKSIIDKHEIRHVTCIGSSMGGYGAALFGALLNADNVIVFGGEVCIGKPFSRSHIHMPKGTVIAFENISQLIKDARNTEFLYFVGEEDVVDLFNVSLLKNYENVSIQILRGVGHFITKFINDIIPINELVKNILASSKESPMDFDFLTLAKVPLEDMSVLYQVYILIRGRRIDEAVEMIERIANEQTRDCFLYNLFLGMIKVRLKQPQEAIPFLEKALLNISSRDAYFELGMALNHSGNLEASIKAYQQCLKIDSSYAPAHHHLGLIYKKLNFIDLSEESFLKAYELEKKNERYIHSYRDILNEQINIRKQKLSNLVTVV